MLSKLFNRLTFYSILAVMAGVGFVAAFSGLLSLYGASQETADRVAVRSIKFPENEQMLKETSARLVREGAALSDIEPAAGNSK